ncbi:IS66 family insertion sequence element accessory protein TnpA [Butyrivibrio sp. AE2032]|uniref:IS66 family insertion sequence element accessory protein TnpA n=1 Tax=Butyrivibrio sp. AE2032 TaxID=1458463 RepID=UPI0016397ABC|nr:hypothetical protein [Butyrivibrio sp. AE2032]
MSDPKQYRTKEEWFKLIQECRKSGLSDAQWCSLNGINRYSFNTAIKRLRKCSYAIPSHSLDDIHDLTLPRQDVVKVDIIPDIQPQQELVPAVTPHLDNSHMIEISLGDVHISLCNGADHDLVASTLSALRSFV